MKDERRPARNAAADNASPETSTGGGVLYVLPSIPDDAPAATKNALAARNACVTEGRCPACGAQPELHPDRTYPEVMHLVFSHENDCPAADPWAA